MQKFNRFSQLLGMGLALGAVTGCASNTVTPTTAKVAPAKTVVTQAASCQTISNDEVARLFDRWNAALQSLDPARVAANYGPNAILLPTVSNRPRVTPAAIQDYFAHWLVKAPKGEILQRHITTGCNFAADSGVYRFTYKNNEKVTARYTYVYRYDPTSKQWLISSHHSSAMPQPLDKEPIQAF